MSSPLPSAPVPLANWNGEILPLDEVKVSVLDRGFLFGDAIYEVLRVYRGQPFLFDDHIDRLRRNLEKVRIRADADALGERARATLAASGVREGLIYMQVTRGAAPRTHHFPGPEVRPNELIWVREFSDPYIEQRRTGAAAILIPDLRWKRCDIKSVNLLANVLGAEEAHESGCAEALFVNESGQVIEGTRTSLFGVRDGTVLTAPLGTNLLPGITRKFLSRLATQVGIPLVEEPLHRDRLGDLDELFLTGTTVEILPLVRIDGQPIADARPGPVARKLHAAYREVLARELPGDGQS